MRELGSLVRRDHDDLHYGLRILGEATAADGPVITMLARVRSHFEAHTEAQTVTLGTMLEHAKPPPALYFMVAQVVAAHLAQETALAALVHQRIGSPAFRERARYLRQLVVHHADHEAACLAPALGEHLPRDIYRGLADGYTLERDRLLSARRAA
jgi:hypothetical protein